MSLITRTQIALMACAFWIGFTLPAASADPIPVHDFAREPEFTDLKISPDGRYIAFITPTERRSVIGVLRVVDKALVGRFRMDEDNPVKDFWWANDTRIVASLATQLGALDAPVRTGELISFDADGDNSRYLIGYRGRPAGGTLGTRLAPKDTQEYGFATVIDPLIDDHDNILIAVRSFANWDDSNQVVYKLNIYNGSKTALDGAPFPGDARFLTDPTGAVRYATTWSGHFGDKTWQRLPGAKEWQPLALSGVSNAAATPLQFSQDGKSVYLKSNQYGPRSCLVQQVLETGELRKLACDDAADLSFTINSFDRNAEPIAAVFEAGKPQIRVLNTGNPGAALLKAMIDAFPGKIVVPRSSTRDGHKALVEVYDDRTPGDYYLFDTQSGKAEYFAAVRQWLDPDLMAERRPIELKARDGKVLRGYLTLPHGVDPRRLPMVVNPHGGPFAIRDQWAFDTEPQLLASRGYAVLQINFRGSGGYGSDFVAAGRKAWGTTMIDDITDATRWTIAQGFADPSRVCIYGASYGGYAALMSAVREPDLYRCVIGYAGVYDLKLLKQDSDITGNSKGSDYFSYAIGGSDDELIAQSPITSLARLKAPVLIVHGEEDKRAPFSQAKALRSAMKAGNLPFEWLSREGEGHGFQKLKNVEAFDETLLGFLNKNIGDGAPVTPAPDGKPTSSQ